MTRTARASSPRALNKDRSEAKNGMDKHIPKAGAGPHNWGRLEDEYEIQTAALDDERAELEDSQSEAPQDTGRGGNGRPALERRLTPEEVQEGLKIRKSALKSPNVDLGDIARTAPVISASPSQSTSIVTDADTA